MDRGDYARDNFVLEKNGDYYAGLYREAGLSGGHIILLNPADSPYYQEDLRQAGLALSAYPGGLQIGGGMNADNAASFLDMGATHVIVTSYVFQEGKIHYGNLKKMKKAVGKEHLVLDLSCRKKGPDYYIVTDRWQRFTEEKLSLALLEQLSDYCAEFLVHAVDVEGKTAGIEEDVARLLGRFQKLPVTYAGGVASLDDLRKLKILGQDRVDVTIGSALDLFGGSLRFDEVLELIKS